MATTGPERQCCVKLLLPKDLRDETDNWSWQRKPAAAVAPQRQPARNVAGIHHETTGLQMSASRKFCTWSGWGSNPRPDGCKPSALPAELPPRGMAPHVACARDLRYSGAPTNQSRPPKIRAIEHLDSHSQLFHLARLEIVRAPLLDGNLRKARRGSRDHCSFDHHQCDGFRLLR